MKIIYPTASGVAVISPTDALPIEEVAAKDVPAGVPYRIVEDSAVPSDRFFREAWEADFSSPDGVGVGALAWFAAQAEAQAAAQAEADQRMQADIEAHAAAVAKERK